MRLYNSEKEWLITGRNGVGSARGTWLEVCTIIFHLTLAHFFYLAKPFNEVQKHVADLLQDRILVGHAVYNDLKVRLLSFLNSRVS